jgi:hypothetical protein
VPLKQNNVPKGSLRSNSSLEIWFPYLEDISSNPMSHGGSAAVLSQFIPHTIYRLLFLHKFSKFNSYFVIIISSSEELDGPATVGTLIS